MLLCVGWDVKPYSFNQCFQLLTWCLFCCFTDFATASLFLKSVPHYKFKFIDDDDAGGAYYNFLNWTELTW